MFIFKFIKWIAKTVLVLLGILPFTRCSSGYRGKDGKVYFNGKEITDKSFVVLSDDFAKDSTTAYYKGRSFQYADVASFEAVDEYYAKDKNKVYYCDEYREGQNYYLTKNQTIEEVKTAIPASFVTAGIGYAKDSKQAYFLGRPFSVKDVASFKAINASFSKDNVQAYLSRVPIAGSDGKTFELLDEFYAKDTNHIYYCENISTSEQKATVLQCDRASFVLLDYPYARDNASVFYNSKKITGADAASFKVLGNGYSLDKQAVYFRSKQIPDADAASFVLVADDENRETFHYAKDKSAAFIDDKKITGAGVVGFKVLGLGYATDGQRIFYKSGVVKNADPLSFKPHPHRYDDEDAEDVNGKYMEGKKAVMQQLKTD